MKFLNNNRYKTTTTTTTTKNIDQPFATLALFEVVDIKILRCGVRIKVTQSPIHNAR